LPTFIIKAAMGAIAGFLIRKESLKISVLVFILVEIIMVLGYFLFEILLYGWASAWVAIGPNVVQGLFGVMIGALLLPLARRLSKKS
ncbi:MAG: hypothetical protein GX786_05185, partial [Clostridiales bacterium]|nr:hypothetical protein [Clostridiales bacterium]